MLLTAEDILHILNLLAEETVVAPTDAFPFRISKRGRLGYSDDDKVASMQGKLSIMLEVAQRSEKAGR
jgi:hypothetical protein